MSSLSTKTSTKLAMCALILPARTIHNISAFSFPISHHIHSSPCQNPENSYEKLMFSSCLLLKTFFVWIHVLVSPQNCRNFIICCAASARHKQQHQKPHDDFLAHRERHIKASPSHVSFFFFTPLFIIFKM